MAAPASPWSAAHSAYSDYETDDAFEDLELGHLSSDDRICPPRSRAGGGSMLLSSFISLSVLGGGAMVYANPPGWLSGLLADAAAITSSLRKGLSTEAGPSHVEQTPQAPAVQPLASSDVTQAPGASAGTPAAPAPPIATAPSASAADTDGTDSTAADASGQTASLPAALAAHLEGYQKQAEAVGLHPDISGAVLSRLTKTDYRNAGIAIKTALAETPDTEVLAWPRPAKPGLALFEVHFVPGAEQNCRRYVVTVTKDRWSTTAPAMEKCGIKPIAQRAAKASVE